MNLFDFALVRAVSLFVCAKLFGASFPDCSGAASRREFEGSVCCRNPVQMPFALNPGSDHSRPQLVSAEFLTNAFLTTSFNEGAATRSPSHLHCIYTKRFDTASTPRSTRTHLPRGNTPNLEIIIHHELLGDSLSQISENPFFEILRLDGGGRSAVFRGVDEALDSLHLEVDRQGGDVVLIWVCRDSVQSSV